MRTVFDQLFKSFTGQAFSPFGTERPSLEIASAPQVADLVFEPHSGAAEAIERELGLLGRMARARCLMEAFHQPPDADDLLECIRKQLTLHHQAKPPKARSSTTLPLWVLSAGRPRKALKALSLEPLADWGAGVYGYTAPRLPVRLVVISELPVVPATLALRLFGARGTFRTAHAEKDLLPRSSLLRRVATHVLAELHSSLQQKPETRLSKEEREFMVSTRSDFKTLLDSQLEQGLQKGIQQGLQKGARDAIRTVFEARFGALPSALSERLERVVDADALAELTQTVAVGTAREFEQHLVAAS